MNYILEAFTGMPVTVSSLVIAISVVVVALLSVVFLEAVKFIINQEAWKTEIVDSKILINKLQNIVCNKSYKQYVRYGGSDYYITPYKNKFIWKRRSGHNRGLRIRQSYTSSYINDSWGIDYFDDYVTKFDTEKEAFEALKDLVKTEEKLTPKPFIEKFILGALALDATIFFFKLYPLQTTIITGIITLVFSIRWVSGKLANNVEKTINHEERITKLEEEK